MAMKSLDEAGEKVPAVLFMSHAVPHWSKRDIQNPKPHKHQTTMMTLTSISKATKHFLYGLLLRLTLLIVLPALMDDGLLLRGVRYTDIDYDVFTDAAAHVAEGRSPYRRHTYRYTPFLAALLSLPMGEEGRQQQMMISSSSAVWSVVFSTKYFGKILFCVADAICGYIILMLRARSRTRLQCNAYDNKRQKKPKKKCSSIIETCMVQYSNLSPEFIDALWWLYNPLPINICTRGSAEALVVLLPVLLTVALTTVDGGGNDDVKQEQSSLQKKKRLIPIPLRACLAGILHGIGIHCKLYPVIYTVSFMANFSRQEQQYRQSERNTGDNSSSSSNNNEATSSIATRQQLDQGWTHTLSEQMAYFQSCMCCTPKSSSSSLGGGFPWKHPIKILMLALLWIQRLFLTPSSILFLLSSIATMAGTTYAAVHYYGHEALEEGLLYHFGRIDHRHNYSMYWYWIYLLRGRLASAEVVAPSTSWVGNVPLIPQILILGFSSLGIAPYDLTFALFCQTFCFVAFNKVMTAQYFTWYLCLLPLCSDRIQWASRRMLLSLSLLLGSILTWLGSAFTLEMLGWRSHRQVWMASVFFFVANVNLLVAILNGYRVEKMWASPSDTPGEGWMRKVKVT